MKLCQHDQRTLLRVFKVLFKDLKKRLAKGEYPVYSPLRVEVIGRKIKYSCANVAQSLPECLRLFGVTMYHLATGTSEHNEPRFNDGYERIDFILWPVLSFCLSGQAYNFAEVENKVYEIIGWKVKVRKFFEEVVRFMSPFISRSKMKAKEGAQINFNRIISTRIVLTKEFWGPLLLILFLLGGVTAFVWNGLKISSPLIVSGMAIVILVWFLVLMIFRQGVEVFCFAGLTSTVVLSLVSFMPIYPEGRHNSYPVAVIERAGNSFVGLFPDRTSDEGTLYFRGRWLNHFKYRLTAGVSTKGRVVFDWDSATMKNSGKYFFTPGFRVEYAMIEPEKNYGRIWKIFPNGIEQEIDQTVADLVPELREFDRALLTLPNIFLEKKLFPLIRWPLIYARLEQRLNQPELRGEKTVRSFALYYKLTVKAID